MIEDVATNDAINKLDERVTSNTDRIDTLEDRVDILDIKVDEIQTCIRSSASTACSIKR